MKKKVFITGASGNLGKATVDKFLAQGYQVIATVSPGKKLEDFMENVATYEADLTQESAVADVVAAIVKDHNAIDVAVFLVGGFALGNVAQTDGSLLRKMFSLNFETAYFSARPVFLQMQKQNGGKIVFIGARPALNAADGKNALAYALSKSLLFKLAEYLNAEGAARNVVAHVVVPGVIDTPVNRKAMPEADVKQWVAPEEISAVIDFISSDAGKSIRDGVVKVYGNS